MKSGNYLSNIIDILLIFRNLSIFEILSRASGIRIVSQPAFVFPNVVTVKGKWAIVIFHDGLLNMFIYSSL